MSLTAARLLHGLCAAAPEVIVTGVAMDSRRVAVGDLFLACRGSGQQHGLQHVQQALQRGAAAVAWEPAPGIAAPSLDVPDIPVPGLAALAGEIAARFHGRPGDALRLYAVTGTDGKTSTAHLLAQTLDRLGQPCAYIGTLGAGRLGALAPATHTTPDPVSLQAQLAEQLERGVRCVAMEVSSHALDQRRVSGLRFDAAILSNLTRDHLDYHGTLEHYTAAKRRLFAEHVRGVRIFNRDDATGRDWAQTWPEAVIYGLDGEAPADRPYVLGRALSLHDAGLSLDLETSWGTAQLHSRLLGRFNAYNLMAALAALLANGLPLPDVVQALAQVQTVPGRMEGYRGPGAPALVVVDYAHTPDALRQVLAAARAHCAGALWCVFGCGGDRDRGKRPLMGAAVARLADHGIVTDDNPRSEDPAAIVAEILRDAGGRLQVIHDREQAIRTAVRSAGPGDVVVIAGKGHETTQTCGSRVLPFSDRALAARLTGSEVRA